MDPPPSQGKVDTFLTVASGAHVVSLTLHLYRLDLMDDALADQLLQDPSLKPLQSLTLWSHTRRLMELACQLPLLTTLRLEGKLFTDEAPLLAAAPSLTDLRITRPTPGCWPFMLACPKLHRLAVASFPFSELLASMQEPGWRRLRELSLTSFDGSLGCLLADAMAAAFSCLQSLVVLSLDGENLDSFLPHVHRITTLRRLRIECGGRSVCLNFSDTVLLSLLHPLPLSGWNGWSISRTRSGWNRRCSRWQSNCGDDCCAQKCLLSWESSGVFASCARHNSEIPSGEQEFPSRALSWSAVRDHIRSTDGAVDLRACQIGAASSALLHVLSESARVQILRTQW